jgi:DNA-binding GntR family transcriptional regulator
MTRASALRAINSNKLAGKAYEALRDSILRREFPPGYRLDFDELQSQLAISRTPLHEALNRLASEGLVTTVPYRGTYVTELDARDLAERFHIREMLEIGISEQVVANLTAADLTEIQNLFDEMGHLIRPGDTVSDYFSYLECDMQFQRTIVGLAQNQNLLRIYDGLNLKLQMATVFYLDSDKRITAVHEEHRRIVEALAAGDVHAFRQAIREHIRNARDAVVARVEASTRNQGS